MSLAQYQPYSLISQLRQDIDSLFSRTDTSSTSSATAEWIPAADIAEYTDRFELKVDLPGVRLDAVDVSLANGVLSVSGDRNPLKTAGDENPIRQHVERLEGRFHRRFILPDTVDADSVKAKGENGVLFITIPKTPAVMPRRIPIKT